MASLTHRAGRRLDPAGVWAPERRALTIGLVLTVTLAAFESLSVATIMPVVARDLGGLGLYGWVFSAFFLGSLVGIVAAGQQADGHGLARPYLLGLGLFAVGLLIGGLTPSMPILVAGRAIQGFGAGAVPTVAYVSIGRRYPDAARPIMFAILSSAWIVPGLAGPAIAGLIADHASWRLVFLGLLPLVAIALALTLRALAGSDEGAAARAARPGTRPPGRLWLALRVSTGATLVLAALSARDALSVLLGISGLVVGLPALVRLLPPGTLRATRGLPAVILLRGMLTFGFFGAEAFLPLTLVAVRGASATAAGLTLTAATLTWAVGSWLQARLMASWGARRLIRAGFVLVTLGVAAVIAVLAPQVPLSAAVAAWGLAGLGMGLAYSPISITVLRDAPSGQEGSATSAMQLSDVLGTALGTGVSGAIVAAAAVLGTDPRPGLVVAFGVSVTAVAGGLALTPRLRRAA